MLVALSHDAKMPVAKMNAVAMIIFFMLCFFVWVLNRCYCNGTIID